MISDLVDVDGEQQWHVSLVVAHARRRPTNAELRLVRLAFGMVDAEEDNHEPGRARHLWLIVDPTRRRACEYKVDEVTTVERDGHAWQAPAQEVDERRSLMSRIWGPR